MQIPQPLMRKHLLLTIALALVMASLSACTNTISPVVEAAPTTPVAPEVQAIDPLPLTRALPPISLSIPNITLTVPVTHMGWRVAEINGVRTTEWEVPYAEAGWHVNSAGAGGAGNTVISGHQILGEAVFAPLALGDVVEGQKVLLTDQEGTIFVYQVAEVTEPIPATGATEAEKALVASYLLPSNDAKLTLATGWPDFTTTHYLFVVAEFQGMLK